MTQKTPAIMIQGTCSNAGKSLLTAALCRIFTQDGYRVAPFKAQNMALNSFVTSEGLEIGRAQALQAAACNCSPSAKMNPVLLKPHSDLGSQVIIMGKPIGHMKVKEYIDYKPIAWKAVTKAYTEISSEFDIMVIEGAGSPAEINLKAHDIVNMAMAKYANAKVLLCADIDRGGAFAALVGTLALLDDTEKDCIAGFILNKFRGDASLLEPALQDVTRLTGKPFLGTVPHIKNLNLPEEDSVTFRLHNEDNTKEIDKNGQYIDVALIDLPHISNISDFDALRVEPDVNLRIVRNASELGCPDMLILPGTKNTPADLQYLYKSGLAKLIVENKENISLILGICGGLQMLGTQISDPSSIESAGQKTYKGLNLLPLNTEFLPEKTLRQCSVHYKNKFEVEGYEIHHGCTSLSSEASTLEPVIFDHANNNALAWEVNTNNNRILGTYLHGILDADKFRRHILNDIYLLKGKKPLQNITPYSLDPSLNILASVVRNALDMDSIYKMLGK